MEAARSSEAMLAYRNGHNPEDLGLNLHRRENLKPQTLLLFAVTDELFYVKNVCYLFTSKILIIKPNFQIVD